MALTYESGRLPVCYLILAKPVGAGLRYQLNFREVPSRNGRGQALHQDQQYITIDPLIGVRIPLEKSDREVGQMLVVPKSHRLGLLPVEAADTSVSFTNVQADRPAEAQAEVGLDMNPGDVLFFHGKTIHGSYHNTTKDRWRRTFICHYIGENAKKF